MLRYMYVLLNRDANQTDSAASYSDATIPQHPCLRLVSNSEQVLTNRIGRRLITMEKTRSIRTVSNGSRELIGPNLQPTALLGNTTSYFQIS